MAAARAIVDALDDPFRASVLMREEHSRLLAEARSLSLAGGRRVVRVLDANDGLASALARLDSVAGEAFVILEAGALPARSKLRQWAEKAAKWASIACYPETGAALASEIRHAIEAAGFSVTGDAVEFLGRELAADTATRRAELEKLVVFAAGQACIELDTAMLCCAAGVEASVDLLMSAVMRGDAALASRLAQQVVEEGATGPSLIAGLSRRALRLLEVRLEMQAGRTADEAVRGLLPPVFFREIAAFAREGQLWSEAALEHVLADCRVADMACKRAGSRDTAIAGQLLLTACRQAARSTRRSWPA